MSVGKNNWIWQNSHHKQEPPVWIISSSSPVSIKAEQKGRNNSDPEYLEHPHRHRRNTHSSHRPNEPLRHAPLLTLLLFFRSHTSETDALIIGSCWNSLECCHICFGYTQEITTARAFSVLKWEVLEVAGRPRPMQTMRTDKATHAKEGWATQRGRGEPSTETQKDPPEFNSWTLMCVFSLIQSRSVPDFLSDPSDSKRTAWHHESAGAPQQSFHAKMFPVYEAWSTKWNQRQL